MDDEQDPVGDAISSRRIPHGRFAKRSGRGGRSNAEPFDPLRSLGHYEIYFYPGLKKALVATEPSTSWLEIHELTTNEDGLLGSLDLSGKLDGLLVLAGSRKALRSIVEDLEDAADTDDGHGQIKSDDADADADAGSDDDEADDSDDPPPIEEKSSLEVEDERINRRARAFEQNSFRNPKFWFRWKGHVRTKADEDQGTSSDWPVETGTGYVVFSRNNCATFAGTISCAGLDWEDRKIQGRKIHSHPAPCSRSWGEIS